MQYLFRHIALYLPQYHPIPENDSWWGKGFTEWRNVCKARPLFPGHSQPQLPADLGYYDLRVTETRLEQEALAKAYGVHGFCYYHYWFNGHRLLEKPLDMKMENPAEDLPFMMCWANENWTRRWDGKDKEVLLGQNYNEADDRAHIQHLLPYFTDKRYIKVDGKPVFIVYKPWLMPNPTKTAAIWREEASKVGVELYLIHMVFGYNAQWQQQLDGFDAVLDFEPFGMRRKSIDTSIAIRKRQERTFYRRVRTLISKIQNPNLVPRYALNIFQYKEMSEYLLPISSFKGKMYPSVVPGWDNTARRGSNPTLVLNGNTPDAFKKWLQCIQEEFIPYSEAENFIFINAWNEWAEGNHLEPCTQWGHGYLQAIKQSFQYIK